MGHRGSQNKMAAPKQTIKSTTLIQTPDSDASQLSQRQIELEILDAESIRSELVGPSDLSQPHLQHETTLSNVLS